jgi:gluconate 2-dehydrogenase gamma chain
MTERGPGAQTRRALLQGAAALAGTAAPVIGASAETVAGSLPWRPGAVDPPQKIDTSTWHFFTPEEAAAVEAMVDRLIPPDPKTPGGKDAGCAAFIDGQLAGPFGAAEGLYMEGPFHPGTPTQGAQGSLTPAQLYRAALRSLDAYCHTHLGAKGFAQLDAGQQDGILQGLESGKLTLDAAPAKLFFETLLQNTMEGFFADPLYGGNRDMAGWKMIGFPGARYDYRAYVDQHNKALGLEPVSILSRL